MDIQHHMNAKVCSFQRVHSFRGRKQNQVSYLTGGKAFKYLTHRTFEYFATFFACGIQNILQVPPQDDGGQLSYSLLNRVQLVA